MVFPRGVRFAEQAVNSSEGFISAKATGNVVFGFFARGLEEHLLGSAELDQITEVHIGGVVAATGGLLHVVRHDNQRKFLLPVVPCSTDRCEQTKV